MGFIEQAAAIVGSAQVLTGSDIARYVDDPTGAYHSAPLCVVRPGSTREVSDLMALAYGMGQVVVPVSGNTGVSGGTFNEGAVMLSVERMNAVREVNASARTATVEAGVILDRLRDAADDAGLVFPVVFGARGSAMVGGILSTNAGGSNVLRYGNTRAQCLGIEVVLADGRVMDLMTALHKDNSGYDLRDLMIGAEGTLGIITAAVMKLSPKPAHTVTAMLAPVSLDAALTVLNRLQAASGGAVEACEYMPRSYIERQLAQIAGAREPFDAPHEVNVLVELAGDAGLSELFEDVLGAALEEGLIADAVIAQNDTQRAAMWERRESAAEVTLATTPALMGDIALPVDRLSDFFAAMRDRLSKIEPKAQETCVAHLGDGNIHYVAYSEANDPDLKIRLSEAMEGLVADMRGSFSAEHGVGLYKLGSMERHKNPVALDVMRSIKTALDPKGILNPGKVIPA
ncbi:FAD/FMN-containing dehydrogenase [Maritimibacter alkaliphilus HTCC2654]|uniref:Putative oxidoreductase n=1 Tax=Maritimibacter alkaliphilus HTCC2654 TaxID=314271 RepID=A3VER7_9RHOB|nr:FAD-binding oxidoreductase [Maritimibacter alkaliphilus]EAQ13405.1 putative oxidoreductase [Rhodobacterales bacterium HTCC2654] [Maritimibacter alkaliphilus HTCC2654]TYP85176.1 FAD/FMN-containing dehydrogenase [Maritimibacter alkaliphilus HTCC2654]